MSEQIFTMRNIAALIRPLAQKVQGKEVYLFGSLKKGVLYGLIGGLFSFPACGVAAVDSMDSGEVKPLVLERSVMELHPHAQTEGLELCLHYESLNFKFFEQRSGHILGRLSSHSSEQDLANHYGMANFVKHADECYAQRLADGLPVDGRFLRAREVYVRRADTVALSFLERNIIYDGGPSMAGEVHSVYGRTLDTETGDYLIAKDVFTDLTELAGAIELQLRRDYPEAPCWGTGTSPDIRGLIEAGDRELTARHGGIMSSEVCEGVGTWTLEPRGATFYFNPPSLGAVRQGIYCATILFDEYPHLFQDKYRCGTASYGIELPPGLPVRTVLGDGRGAAVGIYETSFGPFLNFGPLHYQDTAAGSIRPVLVSMADGRSYLYVDTENTVGDKPQSEMRIFDFNGKEITRQTELGRSFFAYSPFWKKYRWNVMSDPEHFFLNSAKAEEDKEAFAFRVGNGGSPEALDIFE